MMFSREDAEEAKRYLSELLEGLAALGLHIDIEELYKASYSSINIYQLEIRDKKSFRKTHDELRKIWRKCSLSKPIAKIIKGLALQLSEKGFHALRRRGDDLFRKETGLDFNRENFNHWVRKARKKDLVRFLMNLISEETHILQGRKYRNEKQGRPRFEPQIMGYVRRGEQLREIKNKKEVDPGLLPRSTMNRFRNLGGYQYKEAAEDLIRNLSCDFYGRIDKVPFDDPAIERIYDQFLEQTLGWIEKDLPKHRVKELRKAVIGEREKRKTTKN
jgi:hypothetical protein